MHLALGRPEAARADAAVALALKPDRTALYVNLAIMLRVEGHIEAARAALETVWPMMVKRKLYKPSQKDVFLASILTGEHRPPI